MAVQITMTAGNWTRLDSELAWSEDDAAPQAQTAFSNALDVAKIEADGEGGWFIGDPQSPDCYDFDDDENFTLTFEDDSASTICAVANRNDIELTIEEAK